MSSAAIMGQIRQKQQLLLQLQDELKEKEKSYESAVEIKDKAEKSAGTFSDILTSRKTRMQKLDDIEARVKAARGYRQVANDALTGEKNLLAMQTLESLIASLNAEKASLLEAIQVLDTSITGVNNDIDALYGAYYSAVEAERLAAAERTK